MAYEKKLIRILYFLIGIFFYNCINNAMAEKPYHHLPDGTFRNPEGSPIRSKDVILFCINSITSCITKRFYY